MAKSKDSNESAAEPAKTRKQPNLANIDRAVVRWVGPGNFRRITVQDWKAVGIDHEEVTWWRDAPLNDVPVTAFDLNDVEFQRCIIADQDFRIIILGD